MVHTLNTQQLNEASSVPLYQYTLESSQDKEYSSTKIIQTAQSVFAYPVYFTLMPISLGIFNTTALRV